MAGKIVSDDSDELFVLETKSTTSETKTVRVEIHDFTNKIEDEKNKKKPIDSPTFKIVGKKLAIRVYPEETREDSTGVGFYLRNLNEEQITVTATFMVTGCSREMSLKKREINPGAGSGWACVLTHEEYKKSFKLNGDIFKLRVMVTLHFYENQSAWTSNG